MNLGTSWGGWSASYVSLFTPGERAPGIHCIGGWVGLRTDEVEMRKILTLPGFVPRPSSP
jgi:hypothetical protein